MSVVEDPLVTEAPVTSTLTLRVFGDAFSWFIDLGRTRRLFTGNARNAVMLLEPTCIWPGCDQPHSWCHADHLTSANTRGPTNPDNGAPLCPRHNHLKEQGFTIAHAVVGCVLDRGVRRQNDGRTPTTLARSMTRTSGQ